jgi:hypothetical protein
MAFVTERSKKGAPTVTIRVDAKAAERFIDDSRVAVEEMKESSNSKGPQNFKVVCYLVESLSTSVKEYRTLRMSEFLGGFTQTLLKPREALTLATSHKQFHKCYLAMQKFLGNFDRYFNQSQLTALEQVTRMSDGCI